MQNKHNKTAGREGEILALDYLLNIGLILKEQNFQIWGGEIDLVMKDKDEYVFVEVKSRYSDEIPFEDLISAKKLRTLERAAELWFRKNKLDGVDWRIDFVGVDLSTKEVDWIKDCTV